MAFHMAVLGWVSVRVGMAYAKQVSSVSKSLMFYVWGVPAQVLVKCPTSMVWVG